MNERTHCFLMLWKEQLINSLEALEVTQKGRVARVVTPGPEARWSLSRQRARERETAFHVVQHYSLLLITFLLEYHYIFPSQ